MFVVSGSEPAGMLTRGMLWSGLLRKAEDPVPFVPAITACRILMRSRRVLVREIRLRGDLVRERVTFAPPRAVSFKRLSGPVLGRITNRIETDAEQGLRLAFSFYLFLPGAPSGGPLERETARRMSSSYLSAIRTTLAATRRRYGRVCQLHCNKDDVWRF